MVVYAKGHLNSFSYITLGMMLMLALKSQIASLKFVLPMEIGMTGLPGSPFLIGRVESIHDPFDGSLQLSSTLNISTRFAVSSSSGCPASFPWPVEGARLTSCCTCDSSILLKLS